MNTLILPLMIGVLSAVSVCAFARGVGLDRDRAFYPVMLIVIASYYLLFAVMGGSFQALIQDGLVAGLFLTAAVLGFRGSLWLVVIGLAAHGAMDLFHGNLIVNPGTPEWWPLFCLSFDVGAAVWLAVSLVSGPQPSSAQDAR